MAKASGRRRSSSSLTPCQHQEDVEEGGEEGSFLSENSGHHHNLMSGYSEESPVMDGPERSPTSILLPLGTITNTGNMSSSSAPVTGELLFFSGDSWTSSSDRHFCRFLSIFSFGGEKNLFVFLKGSWEEGTWKRGWRRLTLSIVVDGTWESILNRDEKNPLERKRTELFKRALEKGLKRPTLEKCFSHLYLHVFSLRRPQTVPVVSFLSVYITNHGNLFRSLSISLSMSLTIPTEGRQSNCSMKDRTNSIATISEIDGKIHPVQGVDTVCISCRQIISDRYIMRVGETSWHETCLICCLCQIQLTRTCYSREGKLYCKADYDK